MKKTKKKIFGDSYSDNYAIASVINKGKNDYRIFFWGGGVNYVRRYLRAYNLLGDPSIYPLSSNTINISNLPSGTYIVQVISKSGKEYASKLVKE